MTPPNATPAAQQAAQRVDGHPPELDDATRAASVDTRAVLLEAKSLSKDFVLGSGFRPRAHRALHDVSFELQERQIVALVGESGSGKSTVARILAGLLRPSSGSVALRGERELTAKRGPDLAYRRRLQLVFQDPFSSLNPVHRVGHHLERPLLRHGLLRGKDELKQGIQQLLETVGLSEQIVERFPHELSGGQRQRVAIARALSVSPAVLVADEPTSMLDVSIRIGILNLLARLRDERGTTTLFITHDIASARYLAGTTLVMYAGQVVESGPTDDLIEAPAHPYTELLLSAVPEPGRALGDAARTTATQVLGQRAGCSFAARCPQRTALCDRAPPELQLLPLGRKARCHHPLGRSTPPER